MTATPKVEKYRLTERFDPWPAGTILKVTNPDAWQGFRFLNAQRVADEAVENFSFDAGDHAELERRKNQPRPAATPREPIRHDRLMAIFGWDEVQHGAALRIGFPHAKANGTGTATELYPNYDIKAQWTTYDPVTINAWLESVHQFGSTLPKVI